MERYYDIAGIRYRISAPSDELSPDEGALAPFRTEPGQWDHWAEFLVTDRFSPPAGELVFSDADRVIYMDGEKQIHYEGTDKTRLDMAFARILRCGNRSTVQVRRRNLPVQITSKLIQSSLEAEHHIVSRKGILLHSSFIAYGGKAILFTAPSGVGKSTQADLWCRFRNAELMNGDRTAVMLRDSSVRACGVPFCGSSRVYKNADLPVAAIVYLGQAPRTTIEPLTGAAAFRKMWEGCCVNLWNREDVSDCFQTVSQLIQSVPIYHLRCTPDEQAVLVLEHELKNRGVL